MRFKKSIRLEQKDYVPTETEKDLIVLHHTVGGSVESTVDYWKSNPKRIATAYLVERNGDIFEVFDPRYWAFHLGLTGSGGAVDKRSIGIEIASEGPLIQWGGKLYCYGIVSPKTLFTQAYYDHKAPWREYRFFDAYSEEQIAAVIALVGDLCGRFGIPRQIPATHYDADAAYRDFKGVLGHHHLRPDKTDVHPGCPWARLAAECKLALV